MPQHVETVLLANAVRALQDIGVGDEVAKRAEPVARQRLHDHRGRPLAEFEVGRIWGGVGPCLAITRDNLHEVLRPAVDGTVIRYHIEGTAAADDGTMTFADGATTAYDLVVGADGINSAVRHSLFGGPEPRFLSQLCRRFIADDTAIPGITDWTGRLGTKGRTFLTVQLGAGRVYCYADINSPAPAAPAGDWRALFTDFGGRSPLPCETDEHGSARQGWCVTLTCTVSVPLLSSRQVPSPSLIRSCRVPFPAALKASPRPTTWTGKSFAPSRRASRVPNGEVVLILQFFAKSSDLSMAAS